MAAASWASPEAVKQDDVIGGFRRLLGDRRGPAG